MKMLGWCALMAGYGAERLYVRLRDNNEVRLLRAMAEAGLIALNDPMPTSLSRPRRVSVRIACG